MSVASYIKKYFWDIDTKNARPKSHPEFYIKRILEFGDKKAVSWLKSVYGVKKVTRISKRTNLSSKSKNYWSHIFN